MTHPTTGRSRMPVLAMGSPAGLSHRPLYRTALMMLAFVASIVLVAGLSACSSSGSGASGETFTVSHVYGESQLPTKPKKVVTLVPGYTDAMLALGESPAAIAGYAGFPKSVMPWEEGKLQVEPEGSTHVLKLMNPSDVPLEQIAQQEPDLILAGALASNEEIYKKLQDVAPTLPALADGKLDSWQDQTKIVGQLFKKESEADNIVASTEQTLSAVSQEFPAAAGKTFAVAFFGGADNIQVVTDPNDITVQMLTKMGLKLPDSLIGLGGGEGGVQGRLSLETIDKMNSDIIIMGSTGDLSAMESSPLWPGLTAVRENHVLKLDPAAVTSFRVPTVLSVPWSIEQIKPTLATF